METITEGVNNMNISGLQKKNRIQVSNSKKPLFFYVNLAKVFPNLPLYLSVICVCIYWSALFAFMDLEFFQ